MVWGAGSAGRAGCLLCPIPLMVLSSGAHVLLPFRSLKSHHWGSTPLGFSSRGEHPEGALWRGSLLPLLHPLLIDECA